MHKSDTNIFGNYDRKVNLNNTIERLLIPKLIKPTHTNKYTAIHGLFEQYCLKGSDIILRPINFIRNDKTKMLLVYIDDNNKKQIETYSILTAKTVCPFYFHDSNAFVIKTVDAKFKLKSMTLKSNNSNEKLDWLHTYGINLIHAAKVLDECIEEIEKRRFHFGNKKRFEELQSKHIRVDTLMALVESVKNNQKIDLTNETKWSIGNLERLIQTILNELPEPIIPYNIQKPLRKLIMKNANINIQIESKKIIEALVNNEKSMLTSLLAHMERLSKYYLILMSTPRNDICHIRRSICQRLAPIIFRLQQHDSSEFIVNRIADLLYDMMMIVNEC